MILAQYKKEHGLSDEQFSSIRNGDIRALVSSLVKSKEGVYPAVVVDYLTLLANNMIRFIDPHVWLELKDWTAPLTYDWLSSQQIRGELNLYTYIVSDTANWVNIASRYAQEPIVEADEMAEASVGEFLNLHNGIFLVNMSDRGTELSLTPQTARAAVSLGHSASAILVTVHYREGTFDFILSTEPVRTELLSSVAGA
jgi:hypothetical protein